MADINSSLPVRTQTNGDVVVRVSDGTITTQLLEVNADGSVNITDNGGSLTVDAIDLDIRDLTSASDSVEVLQASHDNLNTNSNLQVGNTDVANGNPVPVSDAGGSLTVDSTDFDIRDLSHISDSVSIGDGTNTLVVNSDGSINVVTQEDPGTEVADFNMGSAIAAGSPSNHDYTTLNDTRLYQVMASATGKMKVQVQIETGAGTGIFNTVATGFNSTANPNIHLNFSVFIPVISGAIIRVIRTNTEATAQDLYSTIVAITG